MALAQQKFREIVFQLLFSSDFIKADDEILIEMMMNELEVSKKNVRLALDKVQKIQEKLSEIDALIASTSSGYELERIQSVSKNILRLGVYELFFDPEIPPKVAIAEAIRLSRKFCTPESAAFVNAILDQLHIKRLAENKEVDEGV